MNALRMLRWITLLEGIAYLFLLFVAMPLKYVFLMPMAVRIAGAVHGVLFLAFASALYRTVLERDWPGRAWFTIFVAGLFPFGFLLVDGRLRREERCLVPDGD